MSYTHQLTTELAAGTFSRADTPFIEEVLPRYGYEDPLSAILRKRRVVAVAFDGANQGEVGITRQVESEESADNYTLTVKTPSFTDTKNIYDDVRDIFVEKIDSTVYQRYEIDDYEKNIHTPATCIFTFAVRAYRSGMARL